MGTRTAQRPTTSTADPSSGRPAWLLPVVLGGVAALVVLVAWLLWPEDDAPAEPALSDLPEEVAPPADGEGNDLLDLLATGAELTFHATYEAEVADDEVAGALTLDLYRSEGRVRQDSTVVAQGQEARTAAFQFPDGEVVSCLLQGEWVCASQQQGSEDLFGSLAAQLAGQDVATSEITVLDLTGTCYSLTDESGSSELCVSDRGVPLRITAADGTTLELTAFEDAVDEAVFDPPAEPRSAG